MLQWNWVEGHRFTAQQAALGKEKDELVLSDTHTVCTGGRSHTDAHTHTHTHTHTHRVRSHLDDTTLNTTPIFMGFFFTNICAYLEPTCSLSEQLHLNTAPEESFDKLTLFTDCLWQHGLESLCWLVLRPARSCLPWPLPFYYLSHTDTSHLRWSASGLAPLLSPVPAVVTPNTALQGSVPIYNGGVSSSCIVAVCQRFLLSFTDLFSTSCLRGGQVVIPRVV